MEVVVGHRSESVYSVSSLDATLIHKVIAIPWQACSIAEVVAVAQDMPHNLRVLLVPNHFILSLFHF